MSSPCKVRIAIPVASYRHDSMERELDIAVVGCGIGGLAAASLLRDLGHKVSIFDQFERPQPIGSGLIVQPVGQKVLADLGVLGAALSHGVKIRQLTGRNQVNDRTALNARYDMKDPLRFGLGIHRGTLFSLMLKAAQARQITVHPDHLVLGVNDPQSPYLRIEGNRQAGPFDLVIDATGTSSPISPLTSVELSYGALWGVVSLPEGERELGNCLRQRYVNARKMAGVLPLGHMPGNTVSQVAVFWSMKLSDYHDWLDADIADWKAEATELWPDFGYLLGQIKSHEDMTFATYSHGSLNRFSRKRILYIGDAAHRASPQLGQGANMALLDASVFAQALSEHPLDKALRVYQKRRMRHVKTYQALSLFMTPLYQSDRRISALLRDRVLTPFASSGLGARLVSSIISGDFVDPFGGRKSGQLDASQVRDILRGPGE